MHFVNSSIYHKAISLALEEGLGKNLPENHRHSDELKTGDKYIPIKLLFELYEAAESHLKPGFGLRQGRQLESSDYGTLGLSWRTCMKAREVLTRTERYMVLVTDHGDIAINENGGITTVKLYRESTRQGISIANEATFVMITGILQEVTGQFIEPTGVRFKHRSKAQADFEDFFKCAVEFDSPEYSIEFRTDDLNTPTLKADREIHNFLLGRMDEEKDKVHQYSDHLLKSLHRLIRDSLPGGIPSAKIAAEQLDMSARTLTRRLSNKGLNFRELVRFIQEEISSELLKHTDQSVGEIAFQTGFSEQSAFNRAFKRWTGKSPLEFRHHK